ncbi:MAG: hypothetical protein OXH79_11620 [Boseongicola sp.]|nr:hypothetical protein [Boseongicola sp.]
MLFVLHCYNKAKKICPNLWRKWTGNTPALSSRRTNSGLDRRLPMCMDSRRASTKRIGTLRLVPLSKAITRSSMLTSSTRNATNSETRPGFQQGLDHEANLAVQGNGRINEPAA